MSSIRADEKTTGKVIVTLILTNWVDQVLAERGFIQSEDIRSFSVDNALVDTGATRLCLSADVIEKLGLKQAATIDIQTATGTQTARVFEELILEVEGREGRYDCVELPAGQTPFLGLIPLEDSGLDPDLQNQRLKHLPTKGKETYLTVL